MFCKNCGTEVDDNKRYCPKCGMDLQDSGKQSQQPADEDANKSIKGGALGFVLAFFLGLIGLIIVLVIGDKKAKKAALITFFVSLAAGILLYVIMIAVGVSFLNQAIVMLI